VLAKALPDLDSRTSRAACSNRCWRPNHNRFGLSHWTEPNGGVGVSLVVGVGLLVVVRSTGLALPTNVTPRYGLRLGLGILALVLAAILTE
jgi:hypothetical protein